MSSGEALPVSAIGPTEASPLLGDDNAASRVRSIGDAESAVAGPASDDVRPGAASPAMAGRMHLLIASVGIGVFLVAVDQLLTVATYARIGSELNALNYTSWIATSYFLTLTSFQPLYGKLSDIFGRKECLLFSYTVFALGSLGCGLAQDMVQLCAARVVAGIGGGGMNAVVSILLSDLVPLRERGVYQGYLNIIYAAGTSTGAPLGGILADSVGWRWSFIGQAPLCAVAFVAVYYILDLPAKSHSHWLTKMRQVDFLGAFTLILAVVSLLAGLDCGSNLGWSHTITIVSLSLAPPLFALFIFVEVKLASHPFAPGHIIFNSGLFACYLINFFGIAGQMAMLFFFPLFLQVVHGFTATQSGLFLVPSMAASVAASLGGGIVMKRTGQFYWLNVCSFGILLLSLGPFCAALWYKSWAGEQVGLFLVGIGAGCGITTALVGLLANAATEDSAVVIACSYLFRSLGSSMGISISAALLNQTLRSQLASRLTGDEALEIADKVRQSIDYVKLLPPKVAEQVRASYQVAMIGAMAPTLVFLFIAFTVTFWVRKKSLKN